MTAIGAVMPSIDVMAMCPAVVEVGVPFPARGGIVASWSVGGSSAVVSVIAVAVVAVGLAGLQLLDQVA